MYFLIVYWYKHQQRHCGGAIAICIKANCLLRTGTPSKTKTREQISIREDVLATLRRIEPHFVALNSGAARDEIERTAARDGNHATYLRKQFAQSGTVQGVVRASVDAMRGG